MIAAIIVALAADHAVRDSSELLGAWSNREELLLIEPERVGRVHEGKLTFYRAELLEDELLVQSGAREFYWSCALDAGALVVDDGEAEVRYTRLAKVPDEFRVLVSGAGSCVGQRRAP